MEAAVSASPLFRLPAEIRIMIYGLLLIQEGGISICNDTFKRNKSPREGTQPHDCTRCYMFFSNLSSLKRHGLGHGYPYNLLFQRLPRMPMVSTSIIYTCRLLHNEALPILYTRNSFCFSDPRTAANFRWNTNTTLAVSVQTIIIRLVPRGPAINDSWAQYITRNGYGLTHDFLNLKAMVLLLDDSYTTNPRDWKLLFNAIARNVQGLDWVRVQYLLKPSLLPCLHPTIEKNDPALQGQKEVRKHVTFVNGDIDEEWQDDQIDIQNGYSIMYKHATLWWGAPGEKAKEDSNRIY